MIISTGAVTTGAEADRYEPQALRRSTLSRRSPHTSTYCAPSGAHHDRAQQSVLLQGLSQAGQVSHVTASRRGGDDNCCQGQSHRGATHYQGSSLDDSCRRGAAREPAIGAFVPKHAVPGVEVLCSTSSKRRRPLPRAAEVRPRGITYRSALTRL